VRSLHLQGGSFPLLEVQAFEKHRFYQQAVQLRRWDDLAKEPGLDVPGLEHYRPALEAAVRKRS
jgi:predicted HD phosphohydrolase